MNITEIPVSTTASSLNDPLWLYHASTHDYKEQLERLGLYVNQVMNKEHDPWLHGESADPCTHYVKEGPYAGVWGYTTEIVSPYIPGGRLNIPVLYSRNMVDWGRPEGMADALPELPIYADPNDPKTWAPYVTKSEVTGADGKPRYTMYFAAKMDPKYKEGEHYVGVAESVTDNPAGPFNDTGNVIWVGESFHFIDPSRYDDHKTGEKYLVLGSGDLYIIPLTQDGLNRKSYTKPELILPSNPSNPSTRLYEAGDIMDVGGRHILLTVGPDAFSQYDTRAFYSDEGFRGPYRSIAELTGNTDNIIFKDIPGTRWGRRKLPGHHHRQVDDAGQMWFVHHQRDRHDPRIPGTVYMSRKLSIEPMSFTSERVPIIGNGIPSALPQPRPVFTIKSR